MRKAQRSKEARNEWGHDVIIWIFFLVEKGPSLVPIGPPSHSQWRTRRRRESTKRRRRKL
jgi:hypothetical protein